jgi:hypothetical protein
MRVRTWYMMRVRIVSLDIKSIPPLKVNSWLGWQNSPSTQSCSLYLADLIAIIEVRGEKVIASTVDGDRLWRWGPGVPSVSELCWEFGLGSWWSYLVVTFLLVLHRNPEPLPCLFSYPLYLGHLKLHTVADVDLSHSLGIDFGCAGYESDYDNNTDGWYD